MNKLKTINNKLVAIAIGQEGDKWYVQTTDIGSHTYLSESIQESLVDVNHALAIAKMYQEKYDMKIVIWSSSRVYVEGYGFGKVIESDLTNDYPIIVEFEKPSHPSDSVGYFNINQIQFV